MERISTCLLLAIFVASGSDAAAKGWHETPAQTACFAAPTSDCLFDVATAAAHEMDREDLRDHMIADIVAGEVEVGRMASARKAAGSIVDANSRELAFSSIAIGEARAGDFDAALRTARGIDNRVSARDALYARISKVQATAGDLAAARRTAALIESDTWKQEAAKVLTRVSRGAQPPTPRQYPNLLRRGQREAESLVGGAASLDAALHAAAGIDESGAKAEAFGAVARAYARRGDRQNALRVARQIAGPGFLDCVKACHDARAAAIMGIAVIEIERNDRPAALDIAERLDHTERDIALAKIADAEIGQSKLPDAIETARLILRADLRATALLKVAVALAKSSH